MNNDLDNKANSSTLTNYLPKSNGITSLTMNGSSLQLHKGNGTTSRINLNNTSAIKSKNAGTADYARNSGTAKHLAGAIILNKTTTFTLNSKSGSNDSTVAVKLGSGVNTYPTLYMLKIINTTSPSFSTFNNAYYLFMYVVGSYDSLVVLNSAELYPSSGLTVSTAGSEGCFVLKNNGSYIFTINMYEVILD